MRLFGRAISCVLCVPNVSFLWYFVGRECRKDRLSDWGLEKTAFFQNGVFLEKWILTDKSSCMFPIIACTAYSFCRNECHVYPPLCIQKEFQNIDNWIYGSSYSIDFDYRITTFGAIAFSIGGLVSQFRCTMLYTYVCNLILHISSMQEQYHTHTT